MKSKIAIAACAAALALPMSPALAADGIPGTCYEVTLGGVVINRYSCECLVGLPWVDVSPPPPNVTITFCHVSLPRVDGI